METDRKKQVREEHVKYASYGRTWLIVLKGKRGMAFDRWLVKWTGLSIVSLQYALAGGNKYTPTLHMATTGAKTGQPRPVALPYLRRGNDYIVIGSNAGGPVDPGWVFNVRKHPDIELRVKRRRIAVTGRVASDEEWADLFPFVVERKPNVAHYQKRATTYGRQIPFVILTPKQR